MSYILIVISVHFLYTVLMHAACQLAKIYYGAHTNGSYEISFLPARKHALIFTALVAGAVYVNHWPVLHF